MRAKGLKRYCLSANQREAIEVILGWRGQFRGWHDYVREVYLDGQRIPNLAMKPWHWMFKANAKGALHTLQLAYSLDFWDRARLADIDEFYQRLFECFASFAEVRQWYESWNYWMRCLPLRERFSEIPRERLGTIISELPNESRDAALRVLLGAKTVGEYAHMRNISYYRAYGRVYSAVKRIERILRTGGQLSSDPLVAYKRDLLGTPILGSEEIENLFKKIQIGEPLAITELYLASLSYLVPVAQAERGKAELRGLSVLDLVQEANIALLEVIWSGSFNGISSESWEEYVETIGRMAVIEALHNAPDVRIVTRSVSLDEPLYEGEDNNGPALIDRIAG